MQQRGPASQRVSDTESSLLKLIANIQHKHSLVLSTFNLFHSTLASLTSFASRFSSGRRQSIIPTCLLLERCHVSSLTNQSTFSVQRCCVDPVLSARGRRWAPTCSLSICHLQPPPVPSDMSYFIYSASGRLRSAHQSRRHQRPIRSCLSTSSLGLSRCSALRLCSVT